VELRHRQHARIEQRIRGAKATGLGNLPFDRLRRNAVWLELVLLALDLVAWAQVLLLDDELAVPSPRRCATGFGIRPPSSAGMPAVWSSGCSAAGHGRRRWSRRSPGSALCRCAADCRRRRCREPPGRPG
jgi:hypothetical protein